MRKRILLTPETTYYPRTLYRYLEEKYIESFFSDGKLFLTTYQRCRSHENEVRKDEDEGKYDLHFQGSQQSMFLKRRSGDNSHMLCTSFSLNTKLFTHFKVDSCFRIDDPGGFILAVAKCIPTVKNIHSGSVQYLLQRNARRQFEEKEFMPDFQRIIDVAQQRVQGDLETVWREVHEDHAKRIEGLISKISYYAKPMSYVNEAEYRMVWETDQPAAEGILISCPEAVKYCSRVDA